MLMSGASFIMKIIYKDHTLTITPLLYYHITARLNPATSYVLQLPFTVVRSGTTKKFVPFTFCSDRSIPTQFLIFKFLIMLVC